MPLSMCFLPLARCRCDEPYSDVSEVGKSAVRVMATPESLLLLGEVLIVGEVGDLGQGVPGGEEGAFELSGDLAVGERVGAQSLDAAGRGGENGLDPFGGE